MYYAFIDDDITYPPDYIAKLTAAAERHGRRAVVGVYGGFLSADAQGAASRYSRTCRLNVSDARGRAAVAAAMRAHPGENATGAWCSGGVVQLDVAVPCDAEVDVLGTGTLLFHRSALLELSPRDFDPSVNMADVIFAAHAKRAGARRVLVARPANWLAFIASPKERSVWEELLKNDTLQTQRVLEHRPWLLGEGAAALRGGSAGARGTLTDICLGAEERRE